MYLQDWILYMVHQIIEGIDVGVGQLIALALGLVGSWVGQPASCPAFSMPEWALQHWPG